MIIKNKIIFAFDIVSLDQRDIVTVIDGCIRARYFYTNLGLMLLGNESKILASYKKIPSYITIRNVTADQINHEINELQSKGKINGLQTFRPVEELELSEENYLGDPGLSTLLFMLPHQKGDVVVLDTKKITQYKALGKLFTLANTITEILRGVQNVRVAYLPQRRSPIEHQKQVRKLLTDLQGYFGWEFVGNITTRDICTGEHELVISDLDCEQMIEFLQGFSFMTDTLWSSVVKSNWITNFFYRNFVEREYLRIRDHFGLDYRTNSLVVGSSFPLMYLNQSKITSNSVRNSCLMAAALVSYNLKTKLQETRKKWQIFLKDNPEQTN